MSGGHTLTRWVTVCALVLLAAPALAQPAGPVEPPPLGYTFSEDSGSIGRAGGHTWSFSSVALADHTSVWWGAVDGEVKLSLDGGQFTDHDAEVYDPGTDSWAAAPSMGSARRYHTATRIAGGRVLVVGGEDAAGTLASAEIFDPAAAGGAGAWSPTASLSIARKFHSASLLGDGRVMVIGGADAALSPVAAVEIFDPAGDSGSGSWSTLASGLNTARYLHTATGSGANDVIVAGGRTATGELASAERCDATLGSCAGLASMATARADHAALLDAPDVHVFGGRTPAGSSSANETFSLATLLWSGWPALGTARELHTATRLGPLDYLVVGGLGPSFVPLASAERYAAASWTATGPLAGPRFGHTATLLGDGRVLVAGGVDGAGVLASGELFDPAGGTWSAATPMSRGREGHTATLLEDGRVLVVGGQDGAGEVLAYDAAASNLAGGVVRWAGTTHIRTTSGLEDVCSRFTLTVTEQASGAAVALVDATTESLPPDVGGLVAVPDSSLAWQANLLFEAAFFSPTGDCVGVAWQPHLEFFDANGIAGGPPDAYSSFTAGFYYTNTPPQLTANNHSTVDEGDSTVIAATDLSASDLESPAEEISFKIDDTGAGGPPHNGTLRLDGQALTNGDAFTQADLESGLVTYEHDGGETTDDSFQFSVYDGDGGIASDGPFTIFTHWIDVSPVNDPPEAIDDSDTTPMGVTYTGTFSAQDPDSTELTFSVVSAEKGTANILDAATGAFEFIPAAGELGSAAIVFEVSDSQATDEGTFTLEILNSAPLAGDGSLAAVERTLATGTLSATDPDQPPQTLTYSIVQNGLLGVATVTHPNLGSFTYLPAAGSIGDDSFTFKATDPFGEESNVATVDVSIWPLLDDGDLVVVDVSADAVIVVEPSTGHMAVLSQGGLIQEPSAVDVGPAGEVHVMDHGGGLIRIDPADGGQTQISPATNFSAPIPGPNKLVLDQGGDVLVADAANGLVRVDSATGTVTPLSSGGALAMVTGVEIDRDDTLIVSDAAALIGGTSSVVRVHPSSGAQTVLSAGGNLVLPFSVDLEADRRIVVADVAAFLGAPSNLVIRVDPVTGTNSVLGHGADLATAWGVAVGAGGGIYVPNNEGGQIVEVDPTTGAQSTFATGAPLDQPADVDVVLHQSCESAGDLDLGDRVIYATVACVAGGTLTTTGTVEVTSSGRLALHAVTRLALGNGLWVGAGGGLSMTTGPP